MGCLANKFFAKVWMGHFMLLTYKMIKGVVFVHLWFSKREA